MVIQSAGISIWAAGIRQRMANDPGRQDLDDHILCNGFLFLDEYLEDILSGARTEPIIELTKTPGRRKDTSKKDRVAATARAKTFAAQSEDKENISVVKSTTFAKKAPTSFQKALLKASQDNQPPDATVVQSNFIICSIDGPSIFFDNELGRGISRGQDEAQEEEAVEILITPPLARTVPRKSDDNITPPILSPIANLMTGFSPDSNPGFTSHQVNNVPSVDLSIIAEGDENDMSRMSHLSSRPAGPIIRDKEISYHIPTDPSNPNGPMATVTVSYDPNADDDDDTQGYPLAFDRTINDSEPTSTASSFPIDPYARDYETHELAQLVGNQQPNERHEPSHSPSATTLTRKPSVPVFPSLPPPSPLRKSTHDPIVAGPITAYAGPSAPIGNGPKTRSSWLTKARDVTAKRASVVSGIKRKSGELAGDIDYITPTDGQSRASKVAKTTTDGGVSEGLSDREKSQGRLVIQPFKAVVPAKPKEQSREVFAVQASTPDANSEGMMNVLKRTVEGLGARVGKSMGKSLGSIAATTEAAEARAAAEARLAQREGKILDGTKQGRLSVSDLVGAYESGGTGKCKERNQSGSKCQPFQTPLAPHIIPESKTSISTTPPHYPSLDAVSHFPPSPGRTTYSIPKFKVQRPIQPEPSFVQPESQPSTQSTVLSSIFDEHSAWPRSSLGTEYTASQGLSQPNAPCPDLNDSDQFDLTKEVGWIQSQSNRTGLRNGPVNSVDSYSQIADRSLAPEASIISLHGLQTEHRDVELETNELPDDDSAGEDADAEPTATSDAETRFKAASSQDMHLESSQASFVAQASSLFSKVMGSSVSSALGGSKRGKAEPVKSIQLAAAAAKKQQEEAERKAARLKEMDKRRAAVASKKADQEAADKSKQQENRQKREREEGPEKTVTKTIIKKVEEEITKKRKVVVEIERKPLSKKSSSKDKKGLGGSRIGKPALHSSQSQSQLASSSTSKLFKQPGLPASASQPSVKLVGSSQGEAKTVGTFSKPHVKDGPTTNVMEDVRQPSQALHAQMQARVQAQMLQARQEEPLIPSESIELPDINSEYSNSDDEDRPRTFDPPDWAQSPVLGLALQSQSRLNPDDIFGPVRPLRMEEIFTTRHSRFRARTSSANWAGTDELTRDEERTYAKRMGYLD